MIHCVGCEMRRKTIECSTGTRDAPLDAVHPCEKQATSTAELSITHQRVRKWVDGGGGLSLSCELP